MPSRGYTTSSRQAQAPSAFYEIFQTDFGQLPPAQPTLTYNAGAGSLGSGTAYLQITWVTAEGESLPSTEKTVSISAGSGAFTITQPAVPTNGSAVIGWRVYSASSTGAEKLQTAALSTTQVSASVVTTQGTLIGVFPVATTSVQVLIYGTGAVPPTFDQSGLQLPLPSIAANTTVDYYARIPNSCGLWEVQKSVGFMRPQGLTEAAGITTGNMDCIAPTYPGTNIASGTNQSNWNVNAGSYCVINGYLFWCIVGGTVASTFVPWPWNTTRFGQTVDGNATWECLGKAVLIRIHFSNSTTGALTPVAQEYDLFLQ